MSSEVMNDELNRRARELPFALAASINRAFSQSDDSLIVSGEAVVHGPAGVEVTLVIKIPSRAQTQSFLEEQRRQWQDLFCGPWISPRQETYDWIVVFERSHVTLSVAYVYRYRPDSAVVDSRGDWQPVHFNMALKSFSIDAGSCKQLADSLAAAPGVAAAAAEAARREAAARARWADLLGRMQWSRAHGPPDLDPLHKERLVATMAELATADLADRERPNAARDTLLRWIAEDRRTDAPDDDYSKQYPTMSNAEMLAHVRLRADQTAWVTQSRPSDFQEWLRETLGHDLENELNAWRDTLSARAAVRAAARAAAERVAAVPAEVAFSRRLGDKRAADAAQRAAADSAAALIAAKRAAADSGRAVVDAERLRRYATNASEQLGNLHVSSITPLPASERGALIVRALNRAKTLAAAEGIEFDPATAPPPQEARGMVAEARTALTSIHRWDLDAALAKGCTVAQPTGCTPLAQWLIQNYRPFHMDSLARRFGGFACRQGHDFDLCTRVASNREGERAKGDKASLAQAFGEWVLSCAVETTLLRPNYSVCTRVTEYLSGSDADFGAPDVEMALGFFRLACAHTTQSCDQQDWRNFEFHIRNRPKQ